MRRRAAAVGLVLGLLGGGCAEFDEWAEPDADRECRRNGYERDDRPPAAKRERPPADEPGVYQER